VEVSHYFGLSEQGSFLQSGSMQFRCIGEMQQLRQTEVDSVLPNIRIRNIDVVQQYFELLTPVAAVDQ